MPESSRAVQRILNIFCISRQSKAFLRKIFSVRKQTILVKHTIIWETITFFRRFQQTSKETSGWIQASISSLLSDELPNNPDLPFSSVIYCFSLFVLFFVCLFFWVMFYNWNVIFISKCSYLLQCICINYWKGRRGVTLMCPQVFALSLLLKICAVFPFSLMLFPHMSPCSLGNIRLPHFLYLLIPWEIIW